MSGSTTRKSFDGDDALRELMSSMLSGRYKEETYLWDVSSVCRSRPESAPRLLALIDRYRRLGRMPASQHEKVKARIEQVLSVIKPAARRSADGLTQDGLTQVVPPANPPAASALADEEVIAQFEEDDELPDDYSEESMTRELLAAAARKERDKKERDKQEHAAAQAAEVAPTPTPRAAPAPAFVPMPAKPAVMRLDAMETRVLAAEPLELGAAPVTRVSSQTQQAPAAAPETATTSIGLGTILHDRYELKQLLGRGGIATVYKAVDRYRVNLGLEDCYVAVKIVQPHPARPGSVAALGREFHNAQLLSHPNVINVFNIDNAGDASFYTMELLDGERVSQVVKRVGVLPRRQALAIIRDIGAAIAHAHSRGVVHADLKPHNVMITRTGQIRVLDFGSGLIRAREPWISEMTPDDSYRQATPAYASCEQLEGWSADPRDDIYALACLAYLLLTGKHPFNMQPSLDARAQRLQPRRPPGLKGEAWRALRRGLSWTREQRTMPVEEWLQQLGVSEAAASLPPLPMLEAGKPYNAWLHRAAAAGVLIAALGMAAFTVEHQDQFDWHPTLTKAHDRLSDAWRGLQALADAPDSATPAVAPAVAAAATLPAPVPPPAVPAHKGTGTGRGGSATHSARIASSEATDASAPVNEPVNEKVAMITPAAAPTARAVSANEYAEDPATSASPPRLEFSAPSYVVPGSEPAARIVIRRNGSTDGDLNFVWWTEEASAKADVDYASLGRRIERIPSGSDRITVYVPIISTPLRHEITQFYVSLGDPGSLHSSGTGTRSLVTIDHGS